MKLTKTEGGGYRIEFSQRNSRPILSRMLQLDKSQKRKKLFIAAGDCSKMIIVSFGIIGFFLLPLHFLKMEPEAPISKLILFIMGDGENKGLRYLIASMSCLFIMGSLINVSNFEKDDKVQPVDADNPVNPPENSKNQPDD